MQKKVVRKRNTPTKQAIVSILQKSNTALAHKDFQEMMGQVDRVTIYRALDRLVLEGRIHKITGLEGSVQYALCHDCDVKTEHHHDHLHFHCSSCQRVVCIENVSPQFSLPAGYQIQETQFMIRGICPNCSQSSEKTASVAPEVT